MPPLRFPPSYSSGFPHLAPSRFCCVVYLLSLFLLCRFDEVGVKSGNHLYLFVIAGAHQLPTVCLVFQVRSLDTRFSFAPTLLPVPCPLLLSRLCYPPYRGTLGFPPLHRHILFLAERFDVLISHFYFVTIGDPLTLWISKLFLVLFNFTVHVWCEIFL